MQILGMERPVPIADIYTEIRILNRVSSRVYRTIEDLHSESRPTKELRSQEKIRSDVRKRIEREIRLRSLKPIVAKINEWFERSKEQVAQDSKRYEESTPDHAHGVRQKSR